MAGEPAPDDGTEKDTRALVLVVDDNEDNRDILSRRLTRNGYGCVAVDCGADALERIAEGDVDLVLLDVMMPGMSGVDCLKLIRREHERTRLPVIMATAKTDSQSVVESLNEGANDYVTKPFDFPVLLARIEAQLSVRDETAEVARASSVDVSGGIDEGTVIDDRYEILGMVGHGGFAAVYRARQLSTGQTVAFKCLSADRVASDPSSIELKRFTQEMEAIGRIDHPNVVRLIDSGHISVTRRSVESGGAWSETPPATPSSTDTEDLVPTIAGIQAGDREAADSLVPSPAVNLVAIEVPYIVMEFLEGKTLAGLLAQQKALPATAAVDLMLPVISALSAAHDEGIVHRDVKPANVFLVENRKGEIIPKVLDFGIAKLVARKEELTIDESFIGTPEYMSPEQGRGDRDLDPRADQFSAAAILYHCITGKKLYQAGSLIGLVRKVSDGAFEPPSAHTDALPEGLEAVLLRALDRDRDRRFRSMISFGNALLPFASESVRRVFEGRLATHTDPPPPPRPKLETSPETPAARVDDEAEDGNDAEPKPSSRPTGETKSGPSPEPKLWMWLGLVGALSALAWAALAFEL